MVIAITEAVQVGIVSGLGAIIVAAISAVAAVKANTKAKDAKATLGEANGHGTVADMGGKTLDALGRIEDRLTIIDRRADRHEERTARIESSLATLMNKSNV